MAINKCTEVCQYTCIQPMFYTLGAFLKKKGHKSEMKFESEIRG